jgi:hypothetical protein
MKYAYLLFIVQIIIQVPAGASQFKSMVKLFAVEFEAARSLKEELENLSPKDNSNEAKLLQRLSDYTDEIGKLGTLMKAHHEGKPIPLRNVVQSLKKITQQEAPLLTEIRKTLFERFDSEFLKRRSHELRDAEIHPEQRNPIWNRAIHQSEIDFYRWFKGEIQWASKPTETQDRNTHVLNWLENNLEQVEELITSSLGDSGIEFRTHGQTIDEMARAKYQAPKTHELDPN